MDTTGPKLAQPVPTGITLTGDERSNHLRQMARTLLTAHRGGASGRTADGQPVVALRIGTQAARDRIAPNPAKPSPTLILAQSHLKRLPPTGTPLDVGFRGRVLVRASDGSVIEITVPRSGQAWPQGRAVTFGDAFAPGGCDPRLGRTVLPPADRPTRRLPRHRTPLRSERAATIGLRLMGVAVRGAALGCLAGAGLLLA